MKKMLVSDYDDTFYTDEESVKKNVSKVKNLKKMEIFLLLQHQEVGNQLAKK